jgi:hypothetical protein
VSDTGILHCFAGDLHKFLGRGFELPFLVRGPIRTVRTTVYGRVGNIAIATEEDDEAYNNPNVSIRGRKATARTELSKDELAGNAQALDGTLDSPQTGIGRDPAAVKALHKRPGSKIGYRWEGDRQVRWVVNYAAPGLFTLERNSLPEIT